jgi:hypothetical protein
MKCAAIPDTEQRNNLFQTESKFFPWRRDWTGINGPAEQYIVIRRCCSEWSLIWKFPKPGLLSTNPNAGPAALDKDLLPLHTYLLRLHLLHPLPEALSRLSAFSSFSSINSGDLHQ